MPGTFDTLFDDDAPMGVFGGYRPQYQSVVAKMGGAPNPDQVTQVTDSADTPDANSAGTVPGALTYPGGVPVLDPYGHPYLSPPGLDMQKNLAIVDLFNEASPGSSGAAANLSSAFDVGPTNYDAMFASLFLPGADMDYQRPNGFFGAKAMQYRPIGYYNYGVMAAKAGYSPEEALQNAGLYNRYFGGSYFGANGLNTLFGHPPTFSNSYGLNGDDAAKFIRQGYKDYQDGRWSQKPADGQD